MGETCKTPMSYIKRLYCGLPATHKINGTPQCSRCTADEKRGMADLTDKSPLRAKGIVWHIEKIK